jgi:hypothetical protein
MNKNCDILYLLGRHPQKLYNVFAEFQNKLESLGIQIEFVQFEQSEEKIIGDIIPYYASPNDSSGIEVTEQARRLESKYQFTFHHLTYPERAQRNRTQQLTETQANNIQMDVVDAVYLEQLIDKLKPRLILRGQGTKHTNYLADRLTKESDASGATFSYDFLGRMLFFDRLSGNEAEIYEVELNPDWSREDTVEEIERYVNSGTIERNGTTDETGLADSLDNLTENYEKIRRAPSYVQERVMHAGKRQKTKVKNILKEPLYDRVVSEESNLFYPLHLPIESTNLYRNHPYVDQLSFVNFLARNLPYDTKLYVREHPHARGMFSPRFILALSNVPNVRVIDPQIDVHNILSQGMKPLCIKNQSLYFVLRQL